jgi:uncharacterized protein
MAINANIRRWLGTGSGNSLRQYIRGWEHLILLVGAAVIFIHLLAQAFIDPEPMSNAADNIVTGIAGPALVLGLALAYPHLNRGLRSITALGLGLFALVTGLAIHVPDMVVVEVTASDVTAVAAMAVGLVLTGVGIWLAWRALPRLAFRLALIPVVPLSLFYVVIPVAIAVGLTNIPRQPIGPESPADYGFAYEDVRFENEDGQTLAGWYIPSENGAAIVLVHGAGKHRVKSLEHAAMVAEHGYGALMIDVQGYGESEGSPVAIGWTGGDDVKAAVRYLQGRSDVDDERIGALGLSMGGEAVVLAAATELGLAAIVADGVEARTFEEATQQPGLGAIDYISAPLMWTSMKGVELLSGVEPPPSNRDLIDDIAPRPVLLISTGSGGEGKWGRLLDERGPSVELWETRVGHLDAFQRFREEYERRTIQLFDEALLGR